jgi:glycosyltransferase involved in cell wall biosynthesis
VGERGASAATPPLTVILPHYDCAEYLAEAVASVLAQDFRDLALVVVDDRSPNDDWLSALRPFRDDLRLRVFATSCNVGWPRLKNKVLETVDSPYVGFQDADDVSLPERFRRQVRLLERDRAEIVGTAFEVVDAAGTVVRRRRMVRNGNLWRRVGKSFVTFHPTTVTRTEVLRRLGGFDGTTRIAADTDFHLRAAHLFRIRNLRAVLYRARARPDSLTGSPETGFGSAVRTAYADAMWRREQCRRKARDPAELSRLLAARANDVEFSLREVDIG